MRAMTRLAALLSAGLFSLALAAPAAARVSSSSSDVPSCGEEKDGKKDEKKNPSADPQCGDEKDGKKDEKKNPSADPQCGGEKDGKKDEKKNPSAL